MSLPSDTRAIDENISVSGQITVSEVAAIAAAGYKSIICNRPDGESTDQTDFAAIEAAANAAELEVRYIPVSSQGMTMDDVAATRTALDELPKPIFAYCRSGARSTNVYAMVNR